jgi:hypothetical protein
MKVIEATWEKKVLETNCFDVEISPNDKIEDFFLMDEDLIKNKKAGYITVRTPSNSSAFLFGLPTRGYTFVEASLKLTLTKATYISPAFLDRFMSTTTVRELKKEDDYHRVFEEVAKGAFNTDRFYINPSISHKQATQRYINWIKTMIDAGEKIFEVYAKNEPVGFFIFKHVDAKAAQGILTGVYKKYSGTAYGTVVMKCLQDTVWELGYDKFLGRVVSNNVPALRLNLMFGNVIDEITYNYVKHV